MEHELRLRIVVVKPPAGVEILIQQGRHDLLAPTLGTRELLSFDFSVRYAGMTSAGQPRFFGEFVQGPPNARFIYVNSGVRAGQSESCWDRRAKVSLATITQELIDKALSSSGACLEARIAGTGGDGGPMCASVPLLDGTWQLVRGKAR